MPDTIEDFKANKWYNYIAVPYQNNFLRTLEELSKLNDKSNPTFIIVGALSLLINRMIHYTVIFDIDILFKDKKSLFDFIELPKSADLKIQYLDDHLMVGESISSLHTMWTSSGQWINVDLVLRSSLYELHCSTLPLEDITYSDTLMLNNKKYDIDLYVANPRNVFIDKIISPRLEAEINNLDSFGVDIKHILILLRYFKDDQAFWNHINKTLKELNKLETARKNLSNLNKIAESIGYAKFQFDYLI